MAVSTSRTMLRHALAPVLLVGTLWIAMSSATNVYVHWLERTHQRILDENLASLRAATTIQLLSWRLAAEYPEQPVQLVEYRLNGLQAYSQIKEQREELGRSATIMEEQQLLTRLDGLISSLFSELDRTLDRPVDTFASTSNEPEITAVRTRVAEIASKISVTLNKLSAINQRQSDQNAYRRKQISQNVYTARIAMLIVGPLLGVLLGSRLSRLLHRSIARIAVTLRDANSGEVSDLGIFDVQSPDGVADLQQQADKIAERMRQVSRELQIARHEVLQSERLAAVGELAAGVAHEIRNPLTSVKLLLQHAVKKTTGPRLDESQILLILEEIRRMEATIQGLLDFSRPPKLNRVSHYLRQTLTRALNLVETQARQQNIQLQTFAGETPLVIEGDPEKLHQVFVNLLMNAIESMRQGGQLTVMAELCDNKSARELIDTANPHRIPAATPIAKITIQDSGGGIPDEILSRLFEPFTTSKDRGTGLGLAITHRIIDEHNGTIQACNLASGGAIFTVLIPAAA